MAQPTGSRGTLRHPLDPEPPTGDLARPQPQRTATQLDHGHRVADTRRRDPSSPSTSTPPDVDSITRSTDTDASHSRYSCASLSYVDDPYAPLFVKPRERSAARRPPQINHGTHARTWAVDQLVTSFLDSKGKGKQVVSLGAGTDTRFWRLRDLGAFDGEQDKLGCWLEVDFAESTASKARVISGSQKMKTGLDGFKIVQGGLGISSSLYHLLPGDLRDFTTSLGPNLISSGTLSPDLPTLFLAECVFVYLPPSSTSDLLRFFSDTFAPGGVMGIVYEMIGTADQFGKIMRANLQSRGIQLPGLDSVPTLLSHASRFTSSPASYDSARALTIHSIRSSLVPSEEKERVAKLEMLDEVEEMELMLSHYCVAWGWKKARNGVGGGFEGVRWGEEGRGLIKTANEK